jgi:Methyltransferase domain
MKNLFKKIIKLFKKVNWYNLRTTKPISRVFGLDRGQPIDRYYIESFLENNSGSIKGKVLEIADNKYTKKFGGKNILESEVLHAVDGNPKATIVGDLATGQGLPENTFDCFIITQTLQFIYEFHSAAGNVVKCLKPGGVALITVAGISQISRYDMKRWGDYWRFTDKSLTMLFEQYVPKENIKIKTYGNVLSSVAFLHGLASDELTREELDYVDQDYQMLITAVINKPL